jgi:hypothetical protein
MLGGKYSERIRMKNQSNKPQIFISHSSLDTWVAKQIGIHIEKCGGDYFLDEANIEHGDDFENVIRAAANESKELVVLLTPWATERPYIWLEMGIFWGNEKRIVGILHGLTVDSISQDPRIPILLKKTDFVNLNEIDSYFDQLRNRVDAWVNEND